MRLWRMFQLRSSRQRKGSVAFAAAVKRNSESEEVQAKKRATWELKREAKLVGLTPEQRERKLRDMDRVRENKRRQAARKKAQAAAHIIETSPSCSLSAFLRRRCDRQP